jgi:hypothetical protein
MRRLRKQVTKNIASVNLELKSGPQVKSEYYFVPLKWKESEASLYSASIVLAATQDYSSGAELDVHVNSENKDGIHWEAFDTGRKERSIDVTELVANGDNQFEFVYRAAFGLFPGLRASCELQAKLVAVFDVVEGKTGGITVDKPAEQKRDPFAGVKEAVGGLGKAAVIGGVVATIGAVGYVVVKKSPQGQALSLVSKLTRLGR